MMPVAHILRELFFIWLFLYIILGDCCVCAAARNLGRLIFAARTRQRCAGSESSYRIKDHRQWIVIDFDRESTFHSSRLAIGHYHDDRMAAPVSFILREWSLRT